MMVRVDTHANSGGSGATQKKKGLVRTAKWHGTLKRPHNPCCSAQLSHRLPQLGPGRGRPGPAAAIMAVSMNGSVDVFQPRSDLMGPEELAHHDALCELRRSAMEAVAELCGGAAAPKQPHVSKFDRTAQDTLAAMRARIRDLELLAEEQDTWVPRGRAGVARGCVRRKCLGALFGAVGTGAAAAMCRLGRGAASGCRSVQWLPGRQGDLRAFGRRLAAAQDMGLGAGLAGRCRHICTSLLCGRFGADAC